MTPAERRAQARAVPGYRLGVLLLTHGATLTHRRLPDGSLCLAARHPDLLALRIAVRLYHDQHLVAGVQVDVAAGVLYWPSMVVPHLTAAELTDLQGLDPHTL